MSLGSTVRGAWARLREGYEAQLVHDAEMESARPAFQGKRRQPIPYDLRPRPVAFGELLRPVFLQFTLPCLALLMAVKLAKVGPAMLDGWRILFWLTFETAVLTWIGRWLFDKRWERLRDEAHARWRWRAEVERLGDGRPERPALPNG